MSWLAKLIWGSKPHEYNGRDGYGYQPLPEDRPINEPPKAP